MKKLHIFTPTEREFLLKINTLLSEPEDEKNILKEVCLFLCGFSKGLHLYPKDCKSHHKVLVLFQEFLSKKYKHEIFNEEYWFISEKKDSKKLFHSYLESHANDSVQKIFRTKDDVKKNILTYGLLMGYPKTACEAYSEDAYFTNTRRCSTLNFGSDTILAKLFPSFSIMNYVRSKKYWQTEYRDTLKKEYHIISQLPEIFPEFHTRKNKQKVENTLLTSKNKNLYLLLSLEEKVKFIACESNKLSLKEQIELSK